MVYLKIGIDADDGDQQQQNIHHYAVFIFSACHKAGKGKVISALHNGFGSDFNIHGFQCPFTRCSIGKAQYILMDKTGDKRLDCVAGYLFHNAQDDNDRTQHQRVDGEDAELIALDKIID